MTATNSIVFPLLCNIKEALFDLIRNLETKQKNQSQLIELAHLLTEAWIEHCHQQLKHACDWMKDTKKPPHTLLKFFFV